MEKINLTPTWPEALNICLFALEHGTPAGKKEALKTLRQMAELAQLHADQQKDANRHIEALDRRNVTEN